VGEFRPGEIHPIRRGIWQPLTPVDEYLVATATAHDAANQQLVLTGFDSQFIRESSDTSTVVAEFKNTFHDCVVFIGANHISGRASGQK